MLNNSPTSMPCADNGASVLRQGSNRLASGIKIRFGPSGLHIFNRTTGTNVLFDEIVPPSNMWSSAPRQVSIALTNTCDLQCSHCYAPKNPAVLAFEPLTRWLVELDNNGCIGVGFGGGEPTLYPRLAELCHYATNKTNLAVTMTTHAHRLSDQLLDEITGNLHFVRVSMDGVGATYESIRGRSFDALVKRITAIGKKVPFGINFVVNKRTIGDLDSATRLAANLGAAEFLLLPEEPINGTGGIDNDTTMALQKWVSEYGGSVPLLVSEGKAEGLPTCNPFIVESGLAAFGHIDASGTLKKTSYDLRGELIPQKGVMEALNKLKLINGEVAQ